VPPPPAWSPASSSSSPPARPAPPTPPPPRPAQPAPTRPPAPPPPSPAPLSALPEKLDALEALLDRAAPEDFPRLIALLEAEWRAGRVEPGRAETIFYHWGASAGPAPLLHALTRYHHGHGETLAWAASQGWRDANRPAAEAFFAALPAETSPGVQPLWEERLCELRPDFAAKWAGLHLAADGFESTRAWAESLPGRLGGEAVAGLAARLADTDAPAAAAWLATQLHKPGLDHATLPVAHAWAATDPAATAAWAATLPPGTARADATAAAVRLWADQDPAAAEKHLATLSPGPERDQSAFYLSARLATLDLPRAIEWAAAIPEASHRVQALAQITRLATQKDSAAPERIAALLAARSLPDEEIAFALGR
jgi:hypothetical protein